MIRERIAAVYPGTETVGLSLWIIEDKVIKKVAVGSVTNSACGGVLARFMPDLLIVEDKRVANIAAGPFRAAGLEMRFSHPGWRSSSLRAPGIKLGALGHNAWRIGYHELVRRGPYKIGMLDVKRFNNDWLSANQRRRPNAT